MFAKVPNALKGHLSWRNHHILVSWKCISRYVYQRLETIGFMHRYLWQNLPVKLDILLHQPMHEVPIIDLANKSKKIDWHRKWQKIRHTYRACRRIGPFFTYNLKIKRSNGELLEMLMRERKLADSRGRLTKYSVHLRLKKYYSHTLYSVQVHVTFNMHQT